MRLGPDAKHGRVEQSMASQQKDALLTSLPKAGYYLLLPILLATVIVYPSSPVLFQLLLGDHQVAVAIAALVIVAITLRWRLDRRPVTSSSSRRIVVLYCLSIGVVCVASFLIHGTRAGIRDSIFLLSICTTILCLAKRDYVRVVENYALFLSLLIIVSGVIVIAFFSGLIGERGWLVSRLSISKTNPVYARQKAGDSNYYMPLYLAVIPIPGDYQDSGSFTRQPFIFTEPTYTWAYLAPLWFLIYSDKVFRRRILCLSAIGGALLFSSAVLGMLSALVALYLVLLSKMIRKRAGVLLLGVLAVLVLALYYKPVLESVAPDKLSQVAYFSERINISDFDIAPFGVNVGGGDEPITYGSLDVLVRYGYVGAIAYVLWSVTIFMWSFRLMGHQRLLGNRLSPRLAFAAVTMSLLMAVKVPQITMLTTLVIVGYWDAKQGSS